ncbi:MAG: DUF2971 domain-containing protein [Bacilli bacterium]|nr:DUF2971 domain-containing protein [Bacilli bacterium]
MWPLFRPQTICRGNEGICVEYEFDDEKVLHDVAYSNNMNNFDLYTALKYVIPTQYFGVKAPDETNKRCMDVCYLPFLRKTKDWSYENEVRLVFNVKENSKIVEYDGIWFYPNVRVKSIYLGCKISEENRKMIESKCEILKIPVHHLSLKKGHNKLIVVD